MPLSNGRFEEFRFDGTYIHFRMEDEDHVSVACAVMVDYLASRAEAEGIRDQSYRTIFTIYRSELEAIASTKYDAGFDRPLITIMDF